MTPEELKLKLKDLFDKEIHLSIPKEILKKVDNTVLYNQLVREKIGSGLHGIYFFHKQQTVYYIGKAGTLKGLEDETYKIGEHALPDRLTATRGRDVEGIDIPTYGYLKFKIKELNFSSIELTVLTMADNVLPAFMEAIALNEYYLNTGKLPKWNNAF